MSTRVAVVDPLPMFVRGLVHALTEQGHPADGPDDLTQWLQQPGPAVVLLTVAREQDWLRLAETAHLRPDVQLIAVLPDAGTDNYLRALDSGAVAAIARDATEGMVGDVVHAALSGHCLLPLDTVRHLMAGKHPANGSTPTDDERDWIRQLATGMTVAQLAKHAGYSERMMFRLLARLYSKLGASNRTMAIIRARDEGWL
jgi:DNA-binding NarL/FixJ family response regulator